MRTKMKIVDNVVVITLKGKLMGGPETEECHRLVKEAISQGINKATIDLSDAEWINSRGMGMLMACYVSLANKGGELRLAGETEKTKSLLRMTKLNTIFKSYETVEKAIRSFR
jgi:anti-sigma B factor antagonist